MGPYYIVHRYNFGTYAAAWEHSREIVYKITKIHTLPTLAGEAEMSFLSKCPNNLDNKNKTYIDEIGLQLIGSLGSNIGVFIAAKKPANKRSNERLRGSSPAESHL